MPRSRNQRMKRLPVIWFSHKYEKMPGESRKMVEACGYDLLEVFVVHKRNLHRSFIDYDTRYFDRKTRKWAYYELSGPKLIVLLLKPTGCARGLFTTMRRWTPWKENYYRNLRGTVVRLEIL